MLAYKQVENIEGYLDQNSTIYNKKIGASHLFLDKIIFVKTRHCQFLFNITLCHCAKNKKICDSWIIVKTDSQPD